MDICLEEHKQEIFARLCSAHFSKIALIDVASGAYQMCGSVSDAERAGDFGECVISLARQADPRDRREMILRMALPRVTERLSKQPEYRVQYRLDEAAGGQAQVVTFRFYTEALLLAAFADAPEPLEAKKRHARLRRMFTFLLESVADNFFEINVQTRACVAIDAASCVETKENYDEQIRWFAEHMIPEEEREAYLRNFAFDHLLANLRKNRGAYRIDCTLSYSGERRGLKVVSKLVTDPDTGEEYVYSYAQDISDVKRQEEKNRQLIEISQKLLQVSQYDGLTGLLNRAAAEKEISDHLRESAAECPGTLIVADVDDFKRFNDTFGHATGDVVLKHVAAALKETFRSSDILCRWGGDEFLVFMKDVKAAHTVRARLERLRRRAGTLSYEENTLAVALSIGAVAAGRGAALDELFQNADQVLYEVKHAGKNSYRICASPAARV